MELWDAHASNRDENSHLPTDLHKPPSKIFGTKEMPRAGAPWVLMLFLLYILWVFLGWGLSATQIRILAVAAEVSCPGLMGGVSLTRVYFPPAWIQSLRHEHFPQGLLVPETVSQPSGRVTGVAVNSSTFKARSRSSSFLRQSLEVRPQQAGQLAKMTLNNPF